MTNKELQELSKRVAEKFGIHFQAWVGNFESVIWLHQDLERVMRLAIEHGVSFRTFKEEEMIEGYVDDKYETTIIEEMKDHDTREQAVIVAVLKALCEVSE